MIGCRMLPRLLLAVVRVRVTVNLEQDNLEFIEMKFNLLPRCIISIYTQYKRSSHVTIGKALTLCVNVHCRILILINLCAYHNHFN